MTRRWDIKREKGGRWWQFWQHGRDRAARRTPSEFREMVFQGVVLGGWVRLDFLCQRHLLSSSMWPTRFEPSTHTHTPHTYTVNVCLDAILRTRLYSIIKDRYWIKRDSATDFAPPPPNQPNPPLTVFFADIRQPFELGSNASTLRLDYPRQTRSVKLCSGWKTDAHHHVEEVASESTARGN